MSSSAVRTSGRRRNRLPPPRPTDRSPSINVRNCRRVEWSGWLLEDHRASPGDSVPANRTPTVRHGPPAGLGQTTEKKTRNRLRLRPFYLQARIEHCTISPWELVMHSVNRISLLLFCRVSGLLYHHRWSKQVYRRDLSGDITEKKDDS